jgi:hypothetical protein
VQVALLRKCAEAMTGPPKGGKDAASRKRKANIPEPGAVGFPDADFSNLE